MTIRTKLTLRYSIVTTIVFLICMVLIYLVSEHVRSNTFYHDLRSEAITKANLFLEGQVEPETMQSIYQNNTNFIDEVEVAVYTPDFEMVYHDAAHHDIIKETREMIDRIVAEREITFYVDKYQGIGMVYAYNGATYVVTAAAYDGYGHDTLNELHNTLYVLFIIGIVLLVVAGYLLSGAALRPIRNVVEDVEEITVAHFDKRLPVKREMDELDVLNKAFNDLLDRLQQAFASQKMFISHVSHELRTPLASAIGGLDLCLQKERTPEQYRQVIRGALEDGWHISHLIGDLLDLAKVDYGKENILMEEVRLDELLLDAREMVLKGHPEYRIELIFGIEIEDDKLITINGNEYLLKIAFQNLMENNCKYSDNHTSFIQISYYEQWSMVRFSDNGIGMSEEDMEKMFELFYRGEQAKDAEGYGIGMTLVHKIITLHQGNIGVASEENEGTTFTVQLTHV